MTKREGGREVGKEGGREGRRERRKERRKEKERRTRGCGSVDHHRHRHHCYVRSFSNFLYPLKRRDGFFGYQDSLTFGLG